MQLGKRALALYRPRKFGFTRIAQELLRDEYDSDPEAAKDRIRAAIAAYKRYRATHNASPLEDLAYRMLGLEEDGSLPEQEMPDEIAELMAELDADDPLPKVE